MSENEVKNIIVKKEYQRFKADKNRNHKANRTYEYLHILQKY